MSDWPAEPERLDDGALNDLAYRIAAGEVFCANSAEAYKHAFPLLILAADLPPSFVENVGAMYEDLSKAGPRSINGFPFFTSGRFLHRDDLRPLCDAIERKQEAIEAAKSA